MRRLEVASGHVSWLGPEQNSLAVARDMEHHAARSGMHCNCSCSSRVYLHHVRCHGGGPG